MIPFYLAYYGHVVNIAKRFAYFVEVKIIYLIHSAIHFIRLLYESEILQNREHTRNFNVPWDEKRIVVGCSYIEFLIK